MKSRVVAFGLLVCLSGQLLCTGVQAQAKPAASPDTQAQARQAFERGRIHYDNGEFAKASVAFEEAYKLSGREGLLYNLYLAYRDANEQEKAAEALRGYLSKVEVIENRAQLEARLKALDEGIAQKRAAEVAKAERERERERLEQERAAQQAAAANQPVAPVAAEKPRDKWWLAPVAVMAGGGALMLGGVITGVMANSKSSELEDKCVGGQCPADLKSTADSGKTLAVVTDVLLFGGLATAAAGGVWLFLKKRKMDAATESGPTANVSCSRTGCAGTVSLRF
jgi:tetratricopeptide (TPR) repeat protein